MPTIDDAITKLTAQLSALQDKKAKCLTMQTLTSADAVQSVIANIPTGCCLLLMIDGSWSLIDTGIASSGIPRHATGNFATPPTTQAVPNA